MAKYGIARKADKGNEEIELPIKRKLELTSQLESAQNNIEEFLTNEVCFELTTLIKAKGLEKIAAIESAINAVYLNDETKYKFQLLSREVFKKYKALMPDKILNKYAPRKNAIVIYSAIEDNIVSADVAEIMNKIQNIVDESIENMIKEPLNQL
ncbi:MAG: hypothetical protein ACM3O3_10920 [Syntrophothermus sp.]